MLPHSKIKYFYHRKIQPGFRTKKKWLVVDIGSGDKPFWRADVFVDDLTMGDVQRASETKTVLKFGKFVDANVLSLPFKDKVFDFSFCSHLLEHVDDPAVAIKEITRVSKSGYLEVPNGILETIQPFISHLWIIFLDNKKLVFVRKSNKMHKLYYSNGRKFVPLIEKSNDPFIRLYWKNHIDFEVIDNLSEGEKYISPKKLPKGSSHKTNYFIPFLKILRLVFYVQKEIPNNILKKSYSKKK